MNENSIRVLLIEDSPRGDGLIREIFAEIEGPTMELRHTESLITGLELLEEGETDVVLLDLSSPDSRWPDTLNQVRAHSPNLPVILFTDTDDEEVAVRAVQAGAQDFLVKGKVDAGLLVRTIYCSRERKRIEDTLKEAAQKFEQTVRELEHTGIIIEEQNRLLNLLSLRDELTGLYNRRHMAEVIEGEFSRALRYGSELSCLMIDLDFFKNVNDTYGHAFGDMVLKEFSTSLKKHTRASEMCFRYGGEEFMVLLPQTDIEGAMKKAERIREFCENKIYEVGTSSTKVTVSIGVASVHRHQPAQSKELLAYADKALYRAKAEGRNRVKSYLEDSSYLLSDQQFRNHDANGITHLKERLSAVLEKTKRASIASLELLVRDKVSDGTDMYNRKMAYYLDLMGTRLRFPPAITETLKRAASLHGCFNALHEEKLGEGKEAGGFVQTQMRDHPYMLAELTELFDFFVNEKAVLLHHHENYDGSGYPEGLDSEQIPFGARLFAVADTLAALTSKKENGETLRSDEIVQEFAAHAGTRFDPMLVNLMLDVIEEKELLEIEKDTLAHAREKVKEAASLER
ncbi:MAG: diguanylate cyclase [Syntrophobacteraceae bacterium]